VRILVTGAAGFIGSHVVEALRGEGHDVVGLDVLHPAAHGGVPDYCLPDLIRGDVRDRALLDAVLPGVGAIVHQAAMVGLGVDSDDLPEYVGCNDLGTAVLLAAAARAGVRRLVLASSMVVYGEGRYSCPVHGTVRPGPRAEGDLAAGRYEPTCPACGESLASLLVPESAPLDPRNGYAATKVAQEHLAGAWARMVGGSVVALRYHNVYGPRMPRDTPYAGVAALFRSALERGEPIRVFEDGAQRRDFVHVGDVARANVAALAATADGTGLRAYNVASGQPHTIGELATEMATRFGAPPPVVCGEYRLGDVRHVVGDPSAARTELGFTARVPFPEGVREFVGAPLRDPVGRLS
jgi:dTDP-L-rhamnose 4-epimerase